MMHRLIASTLFLLLACAACLGQTPFQGLTAGSSTRSDVVRVLGQPVRTLSASLQEFAPPAGIAKVEVEFGNAAQSQVVKRIEVYFLKPITRSALIQKFNLPQRASSNTTNSAGKLVEYFEAPALIVFTYASSDTSGGVSRIGYYSSEAFDIEVAKAPDTPQKPSVTRGSDTSGLAVVPLPPEMRPPPGASSASVDRTGRVQTSGADSSARGSKETKPATTTRTYSLPGDLPATVTTRSGEGGIRPAGAGEDADEKEISLTNEELRRLVGTYRFTQSSIPDLKIAVVGLVSGKLRLTMGSVVYTLVPIAAGDFVTGDKLKSDTVNFKVADRSGIKVRFLLSGDTVEDLFIIEEQSEPMKFFVAVPNR